MDVMYGQNSCILIKREMRNHFNLLLVMLAVYDTCYLFGEILESFKKNFDLTTHLHIILYPYFFYPLHKTAITGSIFSTVSIAFERYTAVHYPLDYNQVIPRAAKRVPTGYVWHITSFSLYGHVSASGSGLKGFCG